MQNLSKIGQETVKLQKMGNDVIVTSFLKIVSASINLNHFRNFQGFFFGGGDSELAILDRISKRDQCLKLIPMLQVLALNFLADFGSMRFCTWDVVLILPVFARKTVKGLGKTNNF